MCVQVDIDADACVQVDIDVDICVQVDIDVDVCVQVELELFVDVKHAYYKIMVQCVCASGYECICGCEACFSPDNCACMYVCA